MAHTYEELTAAIGNTVLCFGQIESMMGMVIAFQYASRENYPSFIADVLGDDGFSFGLRCNAIRKVLIRNGLTEKDAEAAVHPLRALGNTRNLIAHIGKVPFAGQGDEYLHPKKVGGVINAEDFVALRARFDEQYVAAFNMLKEWLDRLSPYLREFHRVRADAEAAASKDPTPA